MLSYNSFDDWLFKSIQFPHFVTGITGVLLWMDFLIQIYMICHLKYYINLTLCFNSKKAHRNQNLGLLPLYYFTINLLLKSFLLMTGLSSLGSSSYYSSGSATSKSSSISLLLFRLFSIFGALDLEPLKIYLKLVISAILDLYAFSCSSIFPNCSSKLPDVLDILDFCWNSQFCNAEDDAVKIMRAIT